MVSFPAKAMLSLLLSLVVLSGCKDNPTIAEACVEGPDNGTNPVIIVGGTFSPSIANQLVLGNSLGAAGYTYCILELKGTEELAELPGTMNILVSGIALAAFADDVLDWSGATQVDLVGHSQGVLAARVFTKYGDNTKVGKLVSLAGPNSGTGIIPLLDFFAGPVFSVFGVTCEGVEPCEQMQIGSDFITDLNAGDMTPGSVEYYAFYTNNDELVWYWGEGLFGIPVVKYDNALLGAGATNVELGEMCPFRVVGHLGMILDPVPIHMTLDALAGNPISVPLLTCLLPPVII